MPMLLFTNTRGWKFLNKLPLHSNTMQWTISFVTCIKIYIFILIISMEPGTEKGDNQCLCTMCNRVFDTMENLQIHMRNVCEPRRLYCGICGLKCANKSNLTRHEKSHGKDSKFRCNIEGCDARFQNKYNLERHNHIHVKVMDTEPCPLCGNSFIRYDNLTRHMRTCSRRWCCSTNWKHNTGLYKIIVLLDRSFFSVGILSWLQNGHNKTHIKIQIHLKIQKKLKPVIEYQNSLQHQYCKIQCKSEIKQCNSSSFLALLNFISNDNIHYQ